MLSCEFCTAVVKFPCLAFFWDNCMHLHFSSDCQNVARTKAGGTVQLSGHKGHVSSSHIWGPTLKLSLVGCMPEHRVAHTTYADWSSRAMCVCVRHMILQCSLLR